MNRALKNIGKIFSGTILSRISGLIRTTFQAHIFGTSTIADAISFAIMFPSLFRQVLGEDMVERAFMPPFKLKYMESKREGWQFASSAFNLLFISLLLVMGILYIVIPILFSFTDTTLFQNLGFVNSSGNFDYQLTLSLSLWVLPFMVLIGSAAFLGGILNFLERNWIFGLAPAFLNIGIIGSIYLLHNSLGGYSIAIGFVVGGVFQFLVQLLVILSKSFRNETNFSYSPTIKIDKGEKKILKRESITIGFNAIFNKSSEIINKLLGSTLITGSISSLEYSTRLYQLPHAVISLSIARGIIPIITEIDFYKDRKKFIDIFSKGITLYILILIPITALMVLNGEEIIYFAFYNGDIFDKNSVTLTSDAFRYFSLAIIPLGIYGFFIRVGSILRRNRLTLYVSIVGSIINIITSLTLIKLFNFDHTGIALATSISSLSNLTLLYYLLHREGLYFDKNRVIPLIKYTFFSTINIIIVILLTVFYIDYTYNDRLEAIISIAIKSTLLLLGFLSYPLVDRDAKNLLFLFFSRRRRDES